MNGNQHYQRAEELLTQAFVKGLASYKESDEDRAILVQAAHAHALLASAAATADTKRFQAAYYEGNGEEPPTSAARTSRTESNNAAARAFLESDK
ncbi:hypothetical protein [Streptomyces sp. NRRL S-920]|uniref:hypothetical protein n=1 Tax=Streptomyces sp. NRRL S-920 TaxID=1463921 RepID=UPI0004CADAAE|nr:hypothetical protein [Streptomyces sp. NRRL S-920]